MNKDFISSRVILSLHGSDLRAYLHVGQGRETQTQVVTGGAFETNYDAEMQTEKLLSCLLLMEGSFRSCSPRGEQVISCQRARSPEVIDSCVKTKQPLIRFKRRLYSKNVIEGRIELRCCTKNM